MTSDKQFLNGKQKALNKLQKAKNQNEVDKDILTLLEIINNHDFYYTTSSCFGRIVLLEIPNIGDKKQAKWLGKWHRIIDVDEVNTAMKKAKNGQLWLLAQSPIIHVISKNNSTADKILKTAISSGFKNSGIKSIEKKIVIEICSTERLDAPVGENGHLFCNQKYLMLLVGIANEIIKKSASKLYKLEQNLQNL